MKKLVIISFVLGVSFLIASSMVLSRVGHEGLRQYVKNVIASKVKIVNQESYVEQKFDEQKFSDQVTLVVSARDADIELVKSDDNKLRLEYPQRDANVIQPVIEKDKISYLIENFHEDDSEAQWSVTMNEKEGNFSLNAATRKYFRVYIPAKIKNVYLKTDSGHIKIENVTLDEARLQTISGDIKLKDANVKKADLNTTSGDQQLTGRFEFLKAWAVSGSLRLKNAEIAKDLDANTVSGDIRVTGQGEPSAQIDAKSQSGEVRIKIPYIVEEIKDTSVILGHQKVKWLMRSVSGDIRVRYQEVSDSNED